MFVQSTQTPEQAQHAGILLPVAGGRGRGEVLPSVGICDGISWTWWSDWKVTEIQESLSQAVRLQLRGLDLGRKTNFPRL